MAILNPANLFAAVCKDDIAVFSGLANEKKEYLALCYGRFPVLSLCYLFNSRKIIKAYESRLIEITDYTKTDEPIAAYNRFKAIAKRSLRLYVQEDGIVSPAEMLAVLEESAHLKASYKRFPKNDKIKSNLNTVYRLNHNQKILQTTNGIIINRISFNRLQKALIAGILALCLVMAAAPFLIWQSILSAFGTGTEGDPFIVVNENLLASAMKNGDMYYLLASDLFAQVSWEASDFTGTMEGKEKNGKRPIINFEGKTNGFISNLSGEIRGIDMVFDSFDGGKDFISMLSGSISDADITFKSFTPVNGGFIKNITSGGKLSNINIIIENLYGGSKEFIGSVTGGIEGVNIRVENYHGEPDSLINTVTSGGRMQDVNISYADFESDVTKNLGFAVKINNGLMSGVNVSISAKLFGSPLINDPIYISCLVFENRGTVENCTVEAVIDIKREGSTDMFLTGICSVNYYRILGCSTSAESIFTADTVDVSGIVTKNSYLLSMIRGIVDGCINNADIFQTTGVDIWSPGVAGIAFENSGVISNCVNNGKLHAESIALDRPFINGQAYTARVSVGGIALTNTHLIENCSNNTDIEAKSVIQHVYAGGIAATNELSSVIRNCRAYGTISFHSEYNQSFDEGYAVVLFTGGISAVNDGEIAGCGSACEYLTVNQNIFLGGITGWFRIYYSILGYTTVAVSTDNYYVNRINVKDGLGAFYYILGNLAYPIDRDFFTNFDDGITVVDSIDELIEQMQLV